MARPNTSDADVVVVGSGAGGGACAWGLAEAGLRVLLLEAGPRYDPSLDYPLSRPDWEHGGFPDAAAEDRYSFGPLQALDPAERELRSWSRHLGRPDYSHRRGFGYHHVRGVGGSTLHYSGEAHRLHPAAMKLASDFGVGADWPLDYAELEPFYTRVEQFLGVAAAEDPVRWRSQPCPLPAHALSYASRKVADAGTRLARIWRPNSLAILSAPYRGRPGCNYCANCARGCPRGDKGSVDVTFIPAALASGRCELRTGTRVVGIEAGARDRVAALTCVDASGVRRRIATRALVLACGAIETPRLLLNSGLGNESGQVGRNLLENVSWASSALHPEPLGSHRGLPVDAKCWDFNAPDAVPGLVGGCALSVATAQANLVGPYQYARRVVGGWGRAHKQAMREQFGHALTVSGDGESLPNPRSFVDLDPQRRDADGLPLARIHSQVDDMAVARLRFLRAQCREALAACGAQDIFEEFGTWDHFSSAHVFGTCRMGTDPAQSVLDRWGRSHRWRNLFVADASVFPSSGGGEAPSLTIQALALRTAGHIRKLALHDEV